MRFNIGDKVDIDANVYKTRKPFPKTAYVSVIMKDNTYGLSGKPNGITNWKLKENHLSIHKKESFIQKIKNKFMKHKRC